ncbi:MAG: hypothetical protein FWD61_20240 [Phycisphaerales bacterium]|nr:hypothetical protein [Phycisphaerales bacterium]
MNTIQSNAAEVRRIVSSRSDAAFPQAAAPTRRQSQSADQILMYAWSIGTTRAAKEQASDRLAPRREEIPPEVYIG